MRSFVKIKPSRNGKTTLSLIDIGISCLSREFFTSLICLLMLFAKIKFSRKFSNLQYIPMSFQFYSYYFPDNVTLIIRVIELTLCLHSGKSATIREIKH